MFKTRYVLIVALMVTTALLTLYIYNKQGHVSIAEKSILDFPRDFEGYSSQDVPLKENIYEILETKNVVMRYYSKAGDSPILFYLIFSPQTNKTSDPPENCLSGEGRTITQKSVEVLRVKAGDAQYDVTVNKLLVEKGKADKQIYLYWFIAGDKFYASYFEQRMKLISAYLRRKPLSGGQIRISTAITGDENEAMERLREFISQSMPFLLKLLS